MRVEDFLRDSARRLPDKTALVAGRPAADFRRARRHVRPPGGGARPSAVSRAATASSCSWRTRSRRWSRCSRCSRRAASSARSTLRRRPTSSPSFSTTAAPARSSPRQRVLPVPPSMAVARSASVKFVVLAGGGRRRSPSAASPSRRRSPIPAAAGDARHRPRSRDAHLHLGLHRLSQGRDDDAPQHRRGGDLDHHLSRERARTTSSSACCRSPSTTASTRC